MSICRKCGQGFEVSENIRSFLVEKKIFLPTLCTYCREQRRISFRNEKHFYRNKCNLCWKPIITIYSPDTSYKPLCGECWWGDKWDGTKIGRYFDFGRPFFEQFSELMKEANLLYLFGTRNINSEYVNQETDDKNCYYNAGGHFNEDCFYNTYAIWCKDTVDGYWVIKSEVCYECIQCERCFNLNFCQDCEGCNDCDFCKECISCRNCFGCYGLRHKENFIFNKQISKEEYENFIKENRKSYILDHEKQSQIQDHFAKFPQPFAHHKRCENSSGDYLINCKNTANSFLSEETWDCENLFIGIQVKNAYDISSYGWGEILYEVASSIEDYDCQFCSSTVNLKFCQYCYQCQNSQNLFGCAGAKNLKYCILNKQYSKEEYEVMKARIVEHMKKTGEYGEFFPIKISPFKYTDTVADEYFLKLS